MLSDIFLLAWVLLVNRIHRWIAKPIAERKAYGNQFCYCESYSLSNSRNVAHFLPFLYSRKIRSCICYACSFNTAIRTLQLNRIWKRAPVCVPNAVEHRWWYWVAVRLLPVCLLYATHHYPHPANQKLMSAKYICPSLAIFFTIEMNGFVFRVRMQINCLVHEWCRRNSFLCLTVRENRQRLVKCIYDVYVDHNHGRLTTHGVQNLIFMYAPSIIIIIIIGWT